MSDPVGHCLHCGAPATVDGRGPVRFTCNCCERFVAPQPRRLPRDRGELGWWAVLGLAALLGAYVSWRFWCPNLH